MDHRTGTDAPSPPSSGTDVPPPQHDDVDGSPGRRRVGLVGLLTAEALSTLGSRLSMLAIPWLVLVSTGSPARMGIVAGAGMLAHVLAGVFGTPLVNRIGVRRVSITADAGSMLAMAGIAAGYRAGLGLLVTLVFVAGALNGVGDRAKRVLLQPQAERAGTPMARVTAVFDGLSRVTTLVSASIAGVLIVWLGPVGPVWVDAVSFAVCAVIVAVVVREPPAAPQDDPAPAARNDSAQAAARDDPAQAAAGEDAEQGARDGSAAGKEPYLVALRGGFRYLRQDSLLFGMVMLFFVTNLFNQASAAVLIPLWVRDVLGSPVALGFIGGAFAVGAILGNVTFAALATRLPRYLTLVVGYFVGGAPRFGILAFSHSLPVVLAVSFVAGVAMASINPTFGTLMYERIPRHLQARVFGLVGAAATGGMPLGGLVGAWAVGALGLSGGLVLCGCLYFAATLTPVIRHRTWRQMDQPAAAAAQPAAKT